MTEKTNKVGEIAIAAQGAALTLFAAENAQALAKKIDPKIHGVKAKEMALENAKVFKAQADSFTGMIGLLTLDASEEQKKEAGVLLKSLPVVNYELAPKNGKTI